ncbi:MAG: glycosyl transferase [Deltaproteobacteria bacterium]|nr:glycosyl transferase [Deltaproteobacteria bacterium]
MIQSPIHIALLAAVMSFALSLVLTPLVRKLALKTGQVAVPKSDRWHRKETALLGGIGIFCSVLGVWITLCWVLGWEAYGKPHLPLMLCAAGMFLLGLVDDIRNMDPQHKLAGQIVIACVIVFLGLRLSWTGSNTVNLLLSILWIVGITNAFNLLDNMDGLAAGIALIGGGFFCVYHLLSGGSSLVVGPLLLIGGIYAGALGGFLVYNFNPASIFMGDAGSLFIGFMMGCMTILGVPSQARHESFIHILSVIAIPIFIVFIPILDTTFVSLMRKLFRRPISRGGRDHSSHRLVAIGFSEKTAVLVLYGFSIVSGILALGMKYLNVGIAIVITIFYVLFVILFWVYLGKVQVYSEKSILSEKESGILTPVLVEITYRRRLFEVLLDFVLICAAYYTAYLLRFEGAPGANLNFFLKSLPILIACQLLAFYFFGVYRGVWESTGIRDLVSYVEGITAGTVGTILILLFLYRFQSFSRAVFVIYWGLMVILVSLSRLSFRLMDEGIRNGNPEGRRTLIYGAGIGGQMMLKEIETNRELDLHIVGFVDDNIRLRGRKVKGYPIMGSGADLDKIIREHDVKELIISFRINGEEKKREIRELCKQKGFETNVRQMKLTIM